MLDVKLGLAIATFRRPDYLSLVLDSVFEQSRVPDWMIVLDNSPDREAERVVRRYRSSALDVSYEPLGRNMGPAGAFHEGVRLCPDHHWLMTVGDDNPFADRDVLAAMDALIRRSASVSVAGVGFAGGRFSRHSGLPIRILDSELAQVSLEVDYIPGGGRPTYDVSILRAKHINFDPSLFFGFEELDLGCTLRSAGYRLVVDGSAMLASREAAGRTNLSRSARPRSRRRSEWRSYFAARNTLVVGRRHGSFVGAAKLIVRSLAGVVMGAMRGDRTFAIARAWGTFDGLFRTGGPVRSRYVPS